MKLTFSIAGPSDAPALAALHTAVANDLTPRYGAGTWSPAPAEKGVLFGLRHSRVVVARRAGRIVGTLRLPNKKPWALDVAYFTPVKKALDLTHMAVTPSCKARESAAC
ncbi:MAG TPA: hypothetical protein VK764_01225 [Terracidiphilus sp.]|nr:hypothetical protein [Terracidiphilus sp.]